MTKKIVFIFCLAIAFAISIVLFFPFKTTESSFVKEVNKTLDTQIPPGDVQYFRDDTGGFHGDGDTVEVIKLNSKDNENFSKNIDDKWMYLNQDSDIYNTLWSSETAPGNNPGGSVLDERITPESDLRFVVFDIENNKCNEKIDADNLLDFYFVGYSYNESKVYIQRTYI
ncbi:MAG: hypothetical protein ACI4HL_06470 [Ruminococcus sp.]